MLSKLIRYAHLLKQRTHRALPSLMLEACRLRLGPGRLGVSEYLGYGLNARDDLDFEQKKEFIGWRVEGRLNDLANASEWRVLTHDKLAFYTFARGADLPFPRVRAVFHPIGRSLPGARSLCDRTQVREFLADADNYPLFGKPVHGGFGRGVLAASSLDAEGERIVATGEDGVSVEDAVERVLAHHAHGYLLQESVLPASNMLDLTDGQLSTLRVVVMLANGKPPWLLHTDWKVPRRGNPVSNFSRGRLGNFVGILDVDSGRIEAAYTGAAEELITLDAHPDTGTPLIGRTIPDWPAVREVVLRAAPLFSGVRLQYWDVALADSGPLLLEVNSTGEVNHAQFWPKPRRGFMNPDNRRYIDSWDNAATKL